MNSPQNEFRYKKLNEFLQTWPLSRVKSIPLEEYTDIGSRDTFCYWLEFGSEELGSISGRPSNKFGIWKRKSKKPIVSLDFLHQDGYAWYKKYGNSPLKAFEKIKNLLVSTIENSQKGDFRNIDGIDLDSISKWKIAFIYSNFKLLPIYKKLIIRKIAHHFDHHNANRARISELHEFILKKKNRPDFFDFAFTYYHIVNNSTTRKYYIIGSKYKDGNNYKDIFPMMIEKSVISTGYFWNHDFSNVIGKSRIQISKWIDKNIPESSDIKFNTAKRVLSNFMSIKEGDIIAIKSHGQFGDLTIIAYACVKEIDESFYTFGDPELGHTIKVEFIEANLNVQTKLSYGQTIHRITPGERDGHFEAIFGSFSYSDAIPNTIEDTSEDEIKEKDITTFTRTTRSNQVVRQIHNNIQNKFATYLKGKYPLDTIKMEKRRIDILRFNETEFNIYEVKPYNSVIYCIREGLGQIMDYYYSNISTRKSIRLIIVGVAKPSIDDVKFINFIKSSLSISFNYIAFDLTNETSIKY